MSCHCQARLVAVSDMAMKAKFCCFVLLFFAVAAELDVNAGSQTMSTILVSSEGRPCFSFEIYIARLITSTVGSADNSDDQRLTNGTSVNYNGQFVADSENESIKSASGGSVCAEPASSAGASCKILAYVSEDEEGSPKVYFKEFKVTKDGLLTDQGLVRSPWKLDDLINRYKSPSPFFQDRPSVANGRIIYVGMRKTCRLAQSCTAIFSTALPRPGPASSVPSSVLWWPEASAQETRCLTPPDVADFSPSISPSGKWLLVASDQNHGFHGEVCTVNSDIYIFRAADGSERRLLINDGAWPSWGATDSTFFFHRLVSDGWWSVYEASITWLCGDPVAMEEKRMTKAGFHAFTPAASRDGKMVALATRRPGESKYRHIEILDLASGEMMKLTNGTNAHHYNPFIDPDDSMRIGYHRCDIKHKGRNELEALRSPMETISIHRIAGHFPSFSRDGAFIAYNIDINSLIQKEKGVYVMHMDGSNKTGIFQPKKGRAFGTSWGKDHVVYSSYGEDAFMTGNTTIHIIAIYLNVVESKVAKVQKVVRLTKELQGNSAYNNNAFPSASPNGKWIVFRSSRASIQNKTHYNLYAMDSENGEFNGRKVVRLTNGPWTDTMCVWSPNGEWIAFASDREEPQSGRYAVYRMHWNESKVKEVMHSNTMEDTDLKVLKVTNNEGNALHPYFSPDSKRLAFATNFAGLSAEPISTPNMFQPSGEVYTCELDNCSITLQRMTWSPYETSLPTWGNGRVTPNAQTLFSKGCSKGPCKFNDGLSLSGENKVAEFCSLENLLSRRVPSLQADQLDHLMTPEEYSNTGCISTSHGDYLETINDVCPTCYH